MPHENVAGERTNPELLNQIWLPVRIDLHGHAAGFGTALMTAKDLGFVPPSDLLRPLPPCGAGERDFRLNGRAQFCDTDLQQAKPRSGGIF